MQEAGRNAPSGVSGHNSPGWPEVGATGFTPASSASAVERTMNNNRCGMAWLGVHGWSVEAEEQVQDGQKAKVTVVRCKFCRLLADEETTAYWIEQDYIVKRQNAVAANIRRDSDAFKQMNKRKAG